MIELDGHSVTAADIAYAAQGPISARLSAAARVRIESSYQVAQRLTDRRPIYGRTTGVGANREAVVVHPDEHAKSLIRSHATSAGELRSAERVRAMLLVRLNQLAAGGSGVSMELADALVSMLNADALPAVREHIGIGTGDLAGMATAALALMGESPTSAPLPFRITLSVHDALPLLSSNAAAIGDAALACTELELLVRAYVVVAALTFVAISGNAEAFSTQVQRVTPFEGARRSAEWMRSLVNSNAVPGRIQDPVSMRAVPQTHGQFLDAVTRLYDVIGRLTNAPTENPLVIEELSGVDEVIHHGGFHAAYLSNALTVAVSSAAQSAKLAVRRLALLNDPAYTGLRPFLAGQAQAASGVLMLEYVAAAALGDLVADATPVGLHVTLLSRGVEDDASFASLAARQALRAVANLRVVVSCEAVAAARALLTEPGRMLSQPVRDAVRLCAPAPTNLDDRDLTADIAWVGEQIRALAELLPSPLEPEPVAIPSPATPATPPA